MIRKRADSREFAGQITLDDGSWDRYSGILDVSGTLTSEAKASCRRAMNWR
jgi:outer membrane receptor for ferric coprogen and ferric-rhodotorulic acid